jgi:dolichyl-phosphate beta-glucosyltransferase
MRTTQVSSSKNVTSSNKIKFAFSLIIGFCLFYYTLIHFEINKTITAIKQLRIDCLLLALLLLICAYLIRGIRWMIWEKNLTYWDSVKLILVGFMGNNILPARLGEILRAHYAAKKTTYGRTAALASVVIERVLDGFIIAIVGIAGIMLVRIDKSLYWPLLFVCALFFLLSAGLIISVFFHSTIRILIDTIHGIFPGHLTDFVKKKINYFLDGLLLIRNGGRMAKALLATALIWSTELIIYYMIATAVFEDFSFDRCLLFLSVVNFASLFPLTVGGIGAIEGAATVYLVNSGIPASESLAMVLIQHAYQFLITTISGGAIYFISGYYAIPLVQNKRETAEVAGATKDREHDVIRDTLLHELNELSAKLVIQASVSEDVYLSIIIPAFNERSRLPRTVLETISWCNRNVPSYELIISDDGSSDDTLEIAKLFADHDKSVRYLACPHLGKGAAVRTGMLNAVGDHVLFMDADGATPLGEIPKLIIKINEGYPVAIGSRVLQNPGETVVTTSLHRKLVGRIFAALVNIFEISGIADTQCGFKMFRKDIVKELFSRQKLNGFAFDVELLYLARKLSVAIAEVPVNWVNQKGSKVRLATDGMKMLKDIFKIRLLHRKESFKEACVHKR